MKRLEIDSTCLVSSMVSLALMEDLEIVCNGSSSLVGSSMGFGRRQQREWNGDF
jgi:hypothetical protein